MSKFAPYSNFGYVSLLKEVTEGTPVVPTNFLKIISENISTNFTTPKTNEIAGERQRNISNTKGQIEISGNIEFYVEPKMIGHFLRGIYGAPVTQTLTANTAFRHVFDVSDLVPTYTFDIKKADAPWVYRYFGVKITKLTLEGDENKIKCSAEVMPRKAFINARVKTSVNSGTTLSMDQTSGLTTSDIILVLQKEDGFTTIAEYTITSIDSETQLTVSTISDQLDVDDLVVIKKQTAVYDQDSVLTWLGGTSILIGDDIDNTSVAEKENFTLEYTNEVEQKWFSGKTESARFPGDVLTKGYFGSGTFERFFDSQLNLDKLRQNIKFGYRVLSCAQNAIEANSAIKASSTFGTTANGFKVEASTAGKAGNDINVTIVVNTIDTLQVIESGNNILIKLANSTSSNNTGTLIASAVDATSLVDATAEGTGAEEFTVAETNVNLGFKQGTSTDVVGRDVNEVSYIQFDNADSRTVEYFPEQSEDNIVNETVPFEFYIDNRSGDQKKEFSTRVYLVNSISSY